MAASNKYRNRLPFIALGIVILFLIIIGACTAGSNDGSYSWLITGLIIVLLCIFMWLKPWKWNVWSRIKTSASTTPTTTPASKQSSPPPSVMKIIWTCISLMLGIALAFWLWLIITSTYRDFQSRPIDRSTPTVQVGIPYLAYGPHTFKKGEENHYNRQRSDYFYPAHNDTKLVFEFRSKANPSSSWKYEVYRRPDGSIQTGDDRIYDNNDKYLWGEHVAILLSEDADIFYSDQPLGK